MKYTILLLVIIISYLNISFAKGQRKIVIVRGDGNYPPEEFTSKGKLQGLHIDIIREVAKRLNFRIEFISVPWTRALHLIETGHADAITYIKKTEKRSKFIYFDLNNMISVAKLGLFALRKNKNEIKYNGDLKNLKKFRIGVLRGYAVSDAFDNASFLNKKFSATKESQLIQQVLLGLVDIGVANHKTINFLISAKKVQTKIYFIKPVLLTMPIYIGFSRKRNLERLAVKFGNELIEFKKTMKYKLILRKWNVDYRG